jgi:hypothetical protein
MWFLLGTLVGAIAACLIRLAYLRLAVPPHAVVPPRPQAPKPPFAA